MSTASTIGERIKAVRQRAGLAQDRFASALGYSRRAVINWEQGAAEPPIGILTKLRRLYDVDPEWVVLGEDDKPRAQYGPTDWARLARIRRDINLACEQIGLDHDDEWRDEMARELFDDGPEAEEENRKQLRRMLRVYKGKG